MQVPHSIDREIFSWFCYLEINLLLSHAYVCHLSPFSQVQRGLPRSPLWPIFAENRLNLVRSKYVKCFSYIFIPCWRLFLLCEMTLCLLSESILGTTAVACRDQYCFCRLQHLKINKNTSISLHANKTSCHSRAGHQGDLISYDVEWCCQWLKPKHSCFLPLTQEQVKLHNLKGKQVWAAKWFLQRK